MVSLTDTPLATGDVLAVDVLNGIAGVFVISEPQKSEARWVAGDTSIFCWCFLGGFFGGRGKKGGDAPMSKTQLAGGSSCQRRKKAERKQKKTKIGPRQTTE